MKKFKIILLIIAVASNSLMAIKRKADDEPGHPSKRQRIEEKALAHNEFWQQQREDFGKRLKDYSANLADFDEENAIANLTVSLASIHPRIQADIKQQIENIIFCNGNHEEFQEYIDNECLSGKVNSAKMTMRALYSSLCFCVQQMPIESDEDFIDAQELLRKFKRAPTLQMALLFAYADTQGIDLFPKIAKCTVFLKYIDFPLTLNHDKDAKIFFSPCYLQQTIRLFSALKYTDIEILNLQGQKLTALPKEIRLLDKLKTLVLSDNLLGVLPVEVYELPNLKNIHISNNPITLPSDQPGFVNEHCK